MAREQIQLLRQVPLFRSFTDRELASIDRLVDEIEIPAGELLTRQGAVGAQSFVIVEGEASVEVNARKVATLEPGDVFGEMAMLDRRPRSATVRSVTPMRLLIVGPAAFETFIAQPGIGRAVMRSLVERLRAVESRAYDTSAEEGAA
jgi:cAMP-dependent protein kinase regulator